MIFQSTLSSCHNSHPSPRMSSSDQQVETNGSALRDSKGWDGKLRVEKKAVITNAEGLSDPEYTDEDAPSVELIDADEGMRV